MSCGAREREIVENQQEITTVTPSHSDLGSAACQPFLSRRKKIAELLSARHIFLFMARKKCFRFTVRLEISRASVSIQGLSQARERERAKLKHFENQQEITKSKQKHKSLSLSLSQNHANNIPTVQEITPLTVCLTHTPLTQ